MDKNILTVSLGNCGGKVVEDYCSVKKFQQIFAGLSYSSLVLLNRQFMFLLLLSYCALLFVVLSAKQVEEQIKATLHEQESFEASITSR